MFRVEDGEAWNGQVAQQLSRCVADEVLHENGTRWLTGFDACRNYVQVRRDAVTLEDGRHDIDEVLVSIIE